MAILPTVSSALAHLGDLLLHTNTSDRFAHASLDLSSKALRAMASLSQALGDTDSQLNTVILRTQISATSLLTALITTKSSSTRVAVIRELCALLSDYVALKPTPRASFPLGINGELSAQSPSGGCQERGKVSVATGSILTVLQATVRIQTASGVESDRVSPTSPVPGEDEAGRRVVSKGATEGGAADITDSIGGSGGGASGGNLMASLEDVTRLCSLLLLELLQVWKTGLAVPP